MCLSRKGRALLCVLYFILKVSKLEVTINRYSYFNIQQYNSNATSFRKE